MPTLVQIAMIHTALNTKPKRKPFKASLNTVRFLNPTGPSAI